MKRADVQEEKEITHVLFLGIHFVGAEELARETNHLRGKLFKVGELPDGFKFFEYGLGFVLDYKGVMCWRGLFHYDGKDWFSLIGHRTERQTPQEFVEDHNESERIFAEQDPDYKPKFVDFQGYEGAGL